MGPSLMSPTSKSGDALLMFTYRRIREMAWVLTLRSASLLAILNLGYKGWKFYNPTTKKVVISERADFDERYFPMSKRPTSASFPAPSAEVESTPFVTLAPVPRTSPAVPKPDSNPYYFPPDSDDSDSDDDSDDDSRSDESLDHGGDMGPPAPPAVDAVAPAPAPERPQTPPHPESPVAPPRPPSPIGIGVRLPRRTRTKPREWWKLSVGC